MRLLSASIGVACLLASSSSTGALELRFGVEKGARIEKRFEAKGEFEMNERRLVLNGEDFDDGAGDLEVRVLWVKDFVFVDEYRDVAEARPTTLAREFRTLDEKETSSAEAGGDTQELETPRESALEGKTVVFTWDAEADTYRSAFEDEEEADAELLEHLVADTDLLAFLPADEIGTGETWRVDAAHLWRLTDPGGYLHLLGEEEESEAELERKLEENQTGELVATYEGTREEGGVTVAVISLRADVATQAEQESVDMDGDPVVEQTRIEVEAEGEILWLVAEGRPHSYRLEGDVEVQYSETTTWIDEETGTDMEFLMEIAMSGTLDQSGTWKAVD
jgi:hypothetical protein